MQLIGIRMDLLKTAAKSWSQDSLDSYQYISSIEQQPE